MNITLELPVPPASNRYWRLWRNRMVVSTEAKRYKERVWLLCKAAKVTMIREPVVVSISWRRAKRQGDLDGRVKILLDAMQGTCFENDSQVVALHAYRSEDKANPGVTVTVERAA